MWTGIDSSGLIDSKLRALEEAGLKILERVSIQLESTEKVTNYLRAKN